MKIFAFVLPAFLPACVGLDVELLTRSRRLRAAAVMIATPVPVKWLKRLIPRRMRTVEHCRGVWHATVPG